MPRPPGLPKTGGRKKGVKNKVTAEARLILDAIISKRLPDLDAMIEDTWRGIEIEKTMPGSDGKPITILGRLNADPGRAAKLILEAAEYVIPKLGRIEYLTAPAADVPSRPLTAEELRAAEQAAAGELN